MPLHTLKSASAAAAWVQLCGPKAIDEVVVDHPDGLHKGITDGAADEAEAAALEVFTHGVGFWRACGNVVQRPPCALQRLAADEAPNVLVECAEFALNSQKRLCAGDGRINFEAIADDARVGEQGISFPLAICSYDGG